MQRASRSLLKLSLALLMSCGVSSALAAATGTITKVIADKVGNRFIVQIAGVSNGCTTVAGDKELFVISPADANYNAVVSTLLAAHMAKRTVEIAHAGCITPYAKISDVSVY